MSHHNSFTDLAEWPLESSSRQSSVPSLTNESESSGILFNSLPTPPNPRFLSQPSSDSEVLKLSSDTTTLELHPSVTVSFNKGSRLFKLAFSLISICKDSHGNLKCIEMGEGPGGPGSFIHTFPNSRLPMPHIEQPIVSNEAPRYIVSFLEEQTVQTAQTIFSAQPHYAFYDREDWIRFQETLLDQKLVFVAGIAEAKSKGRGEECISQNLRIFRTKTGRQIILFFANSQRKEQKRYVLIPLDCIEQIEQGKKVGKPVSLRLRPNLELLAQLKGVQIRFLDDTDQKVFCGLLNQGIGVGAG